MYDINIHNLPFSRATQFSKGARLTNAQKHLFDIISLYDNGAPQLNMSAHVDVPDRATLSDVLSSIRFVLEKYESLRTYYVRDHEFGAFQKVCVDGSLPVKIVKFEGEDLDTLSLSVAGSMQAEPFSLFSPVLLRCAIVIEQDKPKRIIFAFCRLNLDGWSRSIVCEELKKALENGVGDHIPNGMRSPIEQAHWEQSEEGRFEHSRVLDYWSEQLTRFPRSMLPSRDGGATEPFWWYGEIISPRLALYCHQLADRYNVSIATILFTTFSMFFAYINRTPFCAISSVVANHFDQELTGAVGNFPQNAPVFLTLAGDTFGSILKTTEYEAFESYFSGSYWPPAINTLVRRVGEARGIKIELDILCNIGSQVGHLEPKDDLTTKEIEQILPYFRWVANPKFDHNGLYIQCFEPTLIALCADTRYFGKEDIPSFLFAMEAFIAKYAQGFDGDPWDVIRGTGIRRLSVRESWAQIDNCWIDLDNTAELICGCEVKQCALFAGQSTDGVPELTCYLVTDDARFDVGEFFKRHRDSLLSERTTMVPKHYVICESAPSNPAMRSAWESQRILDRGSIELARESCTGGISGISA